MEADGEIMIRLAGEEDMTILVKARERILLMNRDRWSHIGRRVQRISRRPFPWPRPAGTKHLEEPQSYGVGRIRLTTQGSGKTVFPGQFIQEAQGAKVPIRASPTQQPASLFRVARPRPVRFFWQQGGNVFDSSDAAESDTSTHVRDPLSPISRLPPP